MRAMGGSLREGGGDEVGDRRARGAWGEAAVAAQHEPQLDAADADQAADGVGGSFGEHALDPLAVRGAAAGGGLGQRRRRVLLAQRAVDALAPALVVALERRGDV